MTPYAAEKAKYAVCSIQYQIISDLIIALGTDLEALKSHAPSLQDTHIVETVVRQLLLDDAGDTDEACLSYMRRIESLFHSSILGEKNVFTLIEFMFEMIDLEQFEKIFSYLESHCGWLTKFKIPAVTVARCFNVIIPRISRTEMPTLLGRVRVFSDRITGFGVHSHFASAPQPSTLSWDAPEALLQGETTKVTFESYQAIWKLLNKTHKTHNVPLEKATLDTDDWKVVKTDIATIIKELDGTATRVGQIWKVNADFDSIPGKPRASEDHLARDPDANGFFSTNYLTSGRIFAQQIMDPAFRRLLLTEMLQYLVHQSTIVAAKVEQDAVTIKKEEELAAQQAEKDKEEARAERQRELEQGRKRTANQVAKDRLKEKERLAKEKEREKERERLDKLLVEAKARSTIKAEIDAFIESTRKLIERTPPFGKRYLNIVDSILQREKTWVAWKSVKFAPLWQDLPPEDMYQKITDDEPAETSDGAPPAKRRKLTEVSDAPAPTLTNDFGSNNLNQVYNADYMLGDMPEKELLWSEEPEDGEPTCRWKGLRARMELAFVTDELTQSAYEPFTIAPSWRDKILLESVKPEPVKEEAEPVVANDEKNVSTMDIDIQQDNESHDHDAMDVDTKTEIKLEEETPAPGPEPSLEPEAAAEFVSAPAVPEIKQEPAPSEPKAEAEPPKAEPPKSKVEQEKSRIAAAPAKATVAAPKVAAPAKTAPVVAASVKVATPAATPKEAPPKKILARLSQPIPTIDTTPKFEPVPVPVSVPPSLSKFIGRIPYLIQESASSIEMQRLLSPESPGSDAIVPFVFNEIAPKLTTLSNDRFGNFVVQKLLERATPKMVSMLYNLMLRDLHDLCVDAHGTRVVQKLLEKLPSEQLKDALESIKPSAMKLIMHANGTHVMLKFVELSRAGDLDWLIDLVRPQFMALGRNNFGCRVLQRLIEKASPESRSKIMVDVIDNASELIQNPYGNYVVQCVVDLKLVETVEAIVMNVQDSLYDLARQKFASPALEKILRVANERTIKMICGDLFGNDERLATLVGDGYGNFVVQTALEQALKKTPEEYNHMANSVEQSLKVIRRSNPKSARSIENKLKMLDQQRRNNRTR